MNPVLRKDLIGLLRLKRMAVIQVLFVLVLAAMVLASWPQSGVLEGTVNAGLGQQAQIEDALLVGLIIGQLVLLVLFVPGIAAVSLTSEKEGNTLEMLYASRLTPGQIIIGKVLMSAAVPLMLLVTALPFMALLAWRGDVQGHELLWAYAVVVVAAVFLAVLCLCISAMCKQSSTALIISYITVLVVCGGFLVPAAIMLDSSSGQTAAILHYMRGLSPVAAALSLLSPAADFNGTGRNMYPLWQIFVPAALLVTVVCFILLVAKLRKVPGSADGLSNADFGQGARGWRRMMYLIDPKKQPKPFGGPLAALVSKEKRTSQLRSGRWMIRIFYASLLISLGLAVMALMGGGTEHANLLEYVAMVVVTFQLGIVALVSPSLTTPAVSTEIENGTWEVLRLAPVGGGRIFIGKLVPALLPALLPIIALLPAYGALSFVNEAYVQYFLKILPVTALAVAFCCTLGLTCSTFIHNTARATVAAYFTSAAVFVLPMIAWWAAGTLIDPALAARIAFISPLVVALNVLPGGWVLITNMGLYEAHLWVMGIACVVMLACSWVRLSMLLKRG
jgi:ABC-type transport system involved in multi-copper enzyme maturation permease subunit